MKAVNFWKTLFCAALAITAFSACSDDDNDDDGGIPSITVNGKESATVAVKLEGGTTEAVEVVSTGNWVLELSGTETGWCHPSKETGGKGKTSLTFTVDKWEGAASTDERSVTASLTTNGSFEGIPIPKKATVIVKQNGDGSTVVTTNVAEILVEMKKIATSAGAPITADLTLTGIVVSDAEAGGFAGNRSCIIVDNTTEGNAGINVRYPNSGYDFTVGQVITGSIKGAKAALYSGMIQVDIADVPTAFSAVQGQTVDVQPVEITVDQLPDYLLQYVKVKDVQPVKDARGKFFYWQPEGSKATYCNTKFETKVGGSLGVSIYQTNTWAKTAEVPEKSGYICGIVGMDKDVCNIAPRNAKDVAGLTEDLFPEVGPETSTIAGITEAGKYKVENAIVAANYQSGFVMEDATGQMLVYQFISGSTITIPDVGAKVTVTGTVESKNGMLQFAPEGLDIVTDGTGTVKTQTAVELDGAAVTALFNTPVMKYVKYTGKLTVDGNYYNVAIDGTDVIGSISYPNDDLNVKSFDGQVIYVEGWFIGATTASNGTKYFTTLAIKITANEAIPSGKFSNAPTAFAATSPEAQTLNFTANAAAGTVSFAITGADVAMFEYSDVTASSVKINAKGNNESDAPYTATLQLKAANGTLLDEVDLKQERDLAGATVVTIDFSVANEVFPTGKAEATEKDFAYDGYTWKYCMAYYNSSSKYFMLNAKESDVSYLTLPAIAGKKLIQVVATNNKGAAKNAAVAIVPTDSTTPVTGGESQLWTDPLPAEGASDITFDLSGTAVNTSYRVYAIKGNNAQLKKLVLTYE